MDSETNSTYETKETSETAGTNGSNDSNAASGGTTTEEFRLDGDQVISKIKELMHEGNVRRIILKNGEGHILAEFPLSLGVVGALLMPMWAAIGAITALAANLTIVVERKEA